MVYKYHQKWRDMHPTDSSVWDTYDLTEEERRLVKNMRNSKPIIPYTLEVECSSYWGNFEREFLGYSMGILDDVQMGIEFAKEERAMFWEEVGGIPPIKYEVAVEHYALLCDYLLETFQEDDDWEQLTFHTIDWDAMHKDKRDILKIQLVKPLSKDLEDIIIPRMKEFFDKKIYKYMTSSDKLIGIRLVDRKGNVVKEY